MIRLIDAMKDNFILKNGELYENQRKRNPITFMEVLAILMPRMGEFNYTPVQVNEAMRTAVAELTSEIPEQVGVTGARFSNEIEFVKSVLKSKNVDGNKRGDKFTQVLANGNRKDLDLEHVHDYLEFELGAYNRTVERNEKFNIGVVKAALGVLMHETNNEVFINLQNSLRYNSDSAKASEDVLKRILNVMKIEGDFDVNMTVLKHFLWLIKRNLFSLPTVNELWLAIFGAQGCGKNYCSKNIFAGPLKEFYVETELNKLGDIDREIKKFTENLVVNFDELAMGTGEKTGKINDTLLQNLKTIVTRSEMTFRSMGGQKQVKMDKKFVPMSTANTHLYDVIYDETGMRRFFEFVSSQPAGIQFDNKEVKAIADLMPIAYQGIDENLSKGYLDFTSEIGTKISAVQATYRGRTSIDEWIEDMHVVPSTPTSGMDLFDEYRQYTRDCGYTAFSYKKFLAQMKAKFEYKLIDHTMFINAGVK